MSDLTCPYCQHGFEVCHDDGFGYSEFERHEQECPECEKTFVFETCIHFSYSEHKADCLNGEQHKLELSSTYPKQFSKMICTDCDYSRQATEQEIGASK